MDCFVAAAPRNDETLSAVIPGRREAANPESRDAPMCNCTSEVWSFGPSRNNGALGACPNSRCSNLRDSDSTFGYEQVFSSLEYRSNAAAAAERAGLRAERPCLAIYR